MTVLAASPDTTPVFSVSEIASALRATVEGAFPLVRVRGEVTGWKIHSSGHAYGSLKDENAVLQMVCWKPLPSRLNFPIEDGMEVICQGRMTTYPGRSNYQLVVTRIEPAGAGALMALLQQRKEKLAAEGLFDAARKQSLPFLPRCIAVITSPTGAVIRDVLHRVQDRFPTHVQVWPVAVQGESAAQEVVRALAEINTLPKNNIPKPDVIIIARGGGSFEDLWPFQDEAIVRAIAACAIPVISAVGHETDTTLTDYAADCRAPTPTAAAEMAVPVREELAVSLAQLGHRISLHRTRQWQEAARKLEMFARMLPAPLRLFERAAQLLDERAERLSVCLPLFLTRKEEQFSSLNKRMRTALLAARLAQWQEQWQRLALQAQASMRRVWEQKKQAVEHHSRMLEALGVMKVLERGFVLVRKADGTLITQSADAQKESTLTLQFADGEIIARNE